MPDLPAADHLEAILSLHGFDRWAVRLDGRRLRCPHGLLIGPTEECPAGCISPLVVLGLTTLEPAPAVNR